MPADGPAMLEEDCYAQAGELIAAGTSVAVRQAGVDLAVQAMRTWRAGPARLAPVLASALDEPAIRIAATEALCASVTAAGRAADSLVGLLSDPSLASTVAVGLGSAADPRATPQLARLLLAGRWQPRLGDALRAVAPVLSDPAPLVRVARQVLTRYRDPSSDESADAGYLVRAVLRGLTALGPAAAAAVPELTDRLRAAADRGEPVCCELDALAAIGPAAAPAVPLLRHFAAPRTNLAGRARWALVRITGDRSVVDDFLDAYPERPRPLVADRLDDLLAWLADHGGLTDRQGTQVRHLFSQPGFSRLDAATALWKHAGPTVAADLLAALPEYLDNDLLGPTAMNCLVAMGPAARPALPHLDRLITRRRRVAVHLGDPDDEMRADENLLAAAISTRRRIAGTLEGSHAAPAAAS